MTDFLQMNNKLMNVQNESVESALEVEKLSKIIERLEGEKQEERRETNSVNCVVILFEF